MSGQRYSEDFKINAIQRVQETGSVSRVADMLGVQPNSLRAWVKKHQASIGVEPAGQNQSNESK